MSDLPSKRAVSDFDPWDYVENTARAIFKGLPFIGASLEQFIWGPLAERRERRVEQTLSEMAEELHRLGGDHNPPTEEFVRMLERSLPLVGRATNEDKRARFRDLLINSAQLEAGDPRWEDAELAREIIEAVEPPGLAILATLGRTPEAYVPRRGAVPVPDLHLVSQPVPQLIRRQFGWTHEDWSELRVEGTELGYAWDVLEEWTHRLKERRLVLFHNHNARGGFGGVHLTSLGEMVVRWAMQDAEVAAAREPEAD